MSFLQRSIFQLTEVLFYFVKRGWFDNTDVNVGGENVLRDTWYRCQVIVRTHSYKQKMAYTSSSHQLAWTNQYFDRVFLEWDCRCVNTEYFVEVLSFGYVYTSGCGYNWVCRAKHVREFIDVEPYFPCKSAYKSSQIYPDFYTHLGYSSSRAHIKNHQPVTACRDKWALNVVVVWKDICIYSWTIMVQLWTLCLARLFGVD